MRIRLLVSIIVTALLASVAAACGGDDAPTGIRLLAVDQAVDGTTTTLWVGDELFPRLPIPAPGEPEWVLTVPPDPEVLTGGDSYEFVPSPPGQSQPGYVEFDFLAVAEGTTSFTLSRGPAEDPLDSFTLTVEVNHRDLPEDR